MLATVEILVYCKVKNRVLTFASMAVTPEDARQDVITHLKASRQKPQGAVVALLKGGKNAKASNGKEKVSR